MPCLGAWKEDRLLSWTKEGSVPASASDQLNDLNKLCNLSLTIGNEKSWHLVGA